MIIVAINYNHMTDAYANPSRSQIVPKGYFIQIDMSRTQVSGKEDDIKLSEVKRKLGKKLI